ncbi:hypothetical protein [Endozoicomonas sp. Mp262]|uniref:hypothetical protein n=1 Tax=Endozoicomonas sp. Mp262 TaxID=2919499 RepID=UPI0021D9F488
MVTKVSYGAYPYSMKNRLIKVYRLKVQCCQFFKASKIILFISFILSTICSPVFSTGDLKDIVCVNSSNDPILCKEVQNDIPHNLEKTNGEKKKLEVYCEMDENGSFHCQQKSPLGSAPPQARQNITVVNSHTGNTTECKINFEEDISNTQKKRTSVSYSRMMNVDDRWY